MLSEIFFIVSASETNRRYTMINLKKKIKQTPIVCQLSLATKHW